MLTRNNNDNHDGNVDNHDNRESCSFTILIVFQLVFSALNIMVIS